MTTKIIYVSGTAQYARVFEGSQDLGTNLPEDSDQRNKLESVQGQYVMNLMVTPEAKKKAIADGIPTKGMIGQLWKEDSDGNPFYKCTRKHFNPKLVDKETGEQGVVMGAPKVLLKTPEGNKVYTKDDGLIGNGSEVTVKFSVWEEKIVDMVAVLITDLVEYTPEGNDEWEDF